MTRSGTGAGNGGPGADGAPATPVAAGPSTTAVHGGESRDKPGHSLTDPIFATSTYTFTDTAAIVRYIEEKQAREEYGRYGNPSERVVEAKLAALEGAEAATVFSSGMAALVGVLMAHANAGDEIVFFDENTVAASAPSSAASFASTTRSLGFP